MSRVSSLYRLQELDLEISRCHERIAEIDIQLADDEEIKAAQADLGIKEEQLAQARTANSSADHAVESQRAKIENTEKSLYSGSVTNPKELEDLQLESDSLRRYLETLEDRLLEDMLVLEEAELEHGQASQELTQLIASKSGENDLLTADRLDLLAKIDRAETEREAALGNVSAEDLKIYDNFRLRFGGIALALTQNGSCGVCGVDLARSMEQDIRSGNTLLYCEQCGRILYAG